MSRYEVLLRILDRIRAEGATAGFTSYSPPSTELDSISQARSRAYVHLFLKVKFGLLEFRERQQFVTDGTQDGGVDGYFIDSDARVIYFLQSKFRTTATNFESKKITLNEIVSMQIARITSGHDKDERGQDYSGKIKQLIKEISRIEDIGRYKYKVIIIANLDNVLRQLTGGFPAEIFGSDRCYSELVFPVVSGTYYQKEEVRILLDLSNKNAGSKISYEASTSLGDCEITVLFVPTLEIAKTMHKYRNTILKYNPRSYLEFEGMAVNNSIRETILEDTSNEFALLNNGITMISDETSINERIGQRNKAQLFVKNPQIINGGQTAYTLSRIYEENASTAEAVFSGKEVLLKVITLTLGESGTRTNVEELIERISTATNQQTAVTNSDRHSNEHGFERLQKTIFERYGLLFERKRGEFGDGVRDGYINSSQTLDRNIFAKILFASNGYIGEGAARRSFLKIKDPEAFAGNVNELDRFCFGYYVYLALGRPSLNKKNRVTAGKIFAFTIRYFDSDVSKAELIVEYNLSSFEMAWTEFEAVRETGKLGQSRSWKNAGFLKEDVIKHFRR